MNHGILSTVVAALAWGAVALACRQPADAEQIRSVDGMINNVEAASMTLNELDRGRYDRADSVFRQNAPRFAERFIDTLDRPGATLLGNHYLVLRTAYAMGQDHDRVAGELAEASQRLRSLRTDLANGVLDPQRGAMAIATERLLLHDLEANTHRLIDNYRTLQRTWDERQAVDSMLAGGDPVTSFDRP